MMRQGEKVGWWVVAHLDTWMIVVSFEMKKRNPRMVSAHSTSLSPHDSSSDRLCSGKARQTRMFPQLSWQHDASSVATVTRGAFLNSGQVIPPALLSPCFNFFFIAFLPGTRQLLVPQAKWDGRDKGACALSELSLCNQLREADSAMRSKERRLFPATGASLLKQPFSL